VSASGYLLMVLHTHQPFVRHPEREQPVEENWLFEAITESYIPLLEMCEGLLRDGIDCKLTFSLTPDLSEMLADSYRQQGYVRYLEERLAFLERETERLKDRPELRRLARMYHQRFLRCYQVLESWGRNLITAFSHLKAWQPVSLLSSAATHAYLPLWELYPDIVELQIEVGARSYEKCFGHRPAGFWLPECGYFPGLDGLLGKRGIKFFFLDAHGILNGEPRPRYGEYAPVHTPSGVAVFARDWHSHDQVWLKDRGYPGDPFYLDYDGDVGFELMPDSPCTVTHQQGPARTGIRYYRGGAGASREPYDPHRASLRCLEHADHFVQRCRRQAESLRTRLGKEPVLVALFDTEHFGHWWHEGPRWLNQVIRKLGCEPNSLQMITAEEYLSLGPRNQVVNPSTSSWGYQGYSETWLMGRNHWIYPALYKAIDALRRLAAGVPAPDGLRRAALDQYLRELLLAQSSDWAFLMHAQAAQSYPESRVRGHLANIESIRRQLETNCFDSEWLVSVRQRNNIFESVDLFGLYRTILEERA
jgi:1,4-alpha-glucan branching enzyme